MLTGSRDGRCATSSTSDETIREIAGIAVRSPTRMSHRADSGIANDPFGSAMVTRSPTQSREAHSVTSPSACSTTSSTSDNPSHDRTV